jgi:hypothetical protein
MNKVLFTLTVLLVAACGGGSNSSVPSVVVSTLAGTAQVFGSADGVGNAARFKDPRGVAIDSSGNIFIADSVMNTIRKITPAGVVTTFAGTAGLSGSSDGTGAAARFQGPIGIAIDINNNLFVADSYNNIIRKITSAGVVTTFAGTAGPPGSADGIGAAASFTSPKGIAIDLSGNLFITEDVSTVRKITPAGVVTTFAGTAGLSGSSDGTGTAARFTTLNGVAIDKNNTLFVIDGQTIRKITSAGVVTTFAGTAGSSGSADGAGTAAQFNFPLDIAVDSNSNLYIADTNNFTSRKITQAGLVTTFAGHPGWVGFDDGIASKATFGFVYGVGVDSGGNLYVADNSWYIIRKITITN